MNERKAIKRRRVGRFVIGYTLRSKLDAPPPALPDDITLKKDRTDFCLKAAEMHLARATALADTEWKVTILFWGVLLTSGAAFISYSSRSEPPVAGYISHYDWVFITAYIITSCIFLFGFSINQAVSLITERTRYQFFQNQTARELYKDERFLVMSAGHLAPSGTLPAKYTDLFANRVWGTKVITTCLIISSIWLTSQVLANGRSELVKNSLGSVNIKSLTLDLKSGPVVKPREQPLICAFFVCHDDYRFDWPEDGPEPGTIIWALYVFAALGFGGSAIWRGRH